MEVDDLVKLILAVSISVSMVGISIQVMRILGTLNDSLRDIRYMAYQVSKLVDKLLKDYSKLKSGFSEAFSSFSSFNQNFVTPVTGLATTIGNLATILKTKVTGMPDTDGSADTEDETKQDK